MKKYSASDLGDMMQLWIESKPAKESNSFGYFFASAEDVLQAVFKDRRGWEWK